MPAGFYRNFVFLDAESLNKEYILKFVQPAHDKKCSNNVISVTRCLCKSESSNLVWFKFIP